MITVGTLKNPPLHAQFQEVFSCIFPALFEEILRNQALITIPQHFLANPAVSRNFAKCVPRALVFFFPSCSACA